MEHIVQFAIGIDDQNHRQITMLKRDTAGRDNAYAEFVKSLKMSDREFVKRMLEEFEEGEADEKV